MNEITARAQTLVRASPAEVYNAFVEPAVMSRFWFTRRDSGLVEGETVHWYVGSSADAYAIEVRVKQLARDKKIVIEWGDGGVFTSVQWLIEPSEQGGTRLTIEESGFVGSTGDIIARALDSTGGFNQVVIALKALLEHSAAINIVADHA